MLRAAYLTCIALAPLPFGAGPGWAWATLAVLLGVLLLAWGTGVLRGGVAAHRPPRTVALGLLAVALVAGFVAVQTLPGLPVAHPLWVEAATALDRPVAATIALEAEAARAALAKLIMIVAAFWLALQLARHRDDGGGGLAVVAGAAAVYAAYGLVLHGLDQQTVLWMDKPAYREVATGPFVNRNVFAGYLGLGLVAATALLSGRVRRDGAAVLLGADWPWTAVWLTVAGALAATQSRGGIAATALALAVMALVGAPSGPPLRRLAAGLGVGSAVAGAAAVALVPRWHGLDAALDERLAVYGATLELIGQRPWLGHGFGAFEAAFRLVRPEALDRVFAQAHNGYLEAAVGLGVPAALLLLAGLAMPALACFRAARQGSAAGLAGLGAGVLVAGHAVVDFAPQVPAVALTAACLLGLGAGRASTRRRD